MAIPGPKPQPIAMRIARGNPGKRALPPDIQFDALADVPEPLEYLSEHARREWIRLAGQLYRLGLLTSADLTLFGAYCSAAGRVREAEEALVGRSLVVQKTSGEMRNPLIDVVLRSTEAALRLGAEFGLTPASRARVAAGFTGEKKARSPFDGHIPGRDGDGPTNH